MNLLIRNIDALTVEKIDQLAKDNGMSRQEFLNEQLQVIAEMDLIKESQKVVIDAVVKVTEVLRQNYKRLDKMEENYEKLIHLVSYVTGIDIAFFEDVVALQKEMN